MDSDDSTQTILNTISNLIISDVETPDKFLDSETSPTNFSQPPFQPIVSQLPHEPSTFPSSYTDATLIFSPMSSNQSNAPGPMTNNQLELELDNFITQQQHLHNTNNVLKIQPHHPYPQLIQFKLHQQEHKEFINQSTLTLHLNSLLVVNVHPDYIPTTRNTLKPQKI